MLADRLLLAGIAAAAVVALDAVGALLVTVVLVVPAATVRLVCDRIGTLRVGAIALAAAEGVAAVYLADALNVGAGPALAVLGGGVFARRGRRDGAARAGGAGVSGVRVQRAVGRLRARASDALRDVAFAAARRRDRRRARAQRRRQDDAVPRAARRAAGPPRRGRAPGPAGVRAPDRARAARLPRERVRRRR